MALSHLPLLVCLVSVLLLPCLSAGRSLTQSSDSSSRCTSFGSFDNGKRPFEGERDPETGYAEYSDSFTYTVSKDKMSYEECTTYCANEFQTDGVDHEPNGSTFNLASVLSEAENHFLLAYLADLNCGAGDKIDALWLGAHLDSDGDAGTSAYSWDMADISYGFDQSFTYQNFCRVSRIKARSTRAARAGKAGKVELASTDPTPIGQCVSFMPLAVAVDPNNADADGGCAAGTWRQAKCSAKKQCLCKYVETLVYDYFPRRKSTDASP